MPPTSEQFITHMKLRELRAQRDRLHETYSRLLERAAQTPEPAARVQLLYTGLRQITFASQPFHPDVANLELLLPAMATGETAPATIAFWEERLRQELRRGQQRAEAVYRFGALIEEWSLKRTSLPPAGPDEQRLTSELVTQLGQAAPALDQRHTLLDELFAALGITPELFNSTIKPERGDSPQRRVETDEITPILRQISLDPNRSAPIRSEAAQVLASDLRTKELADALTLLIVQLADWSWTEEGVPAQAHWSRTKWRLFIDEDLATSCLLELLGMRWSGVFWRLLGELQENRLRRLRRLLELQAPQIIVDNERRMLEEAGGIAPGLPHDIWADAAAPARQAHQGADLYDRPVGSVVDQRAMALQELRMARDEDSYGADGYSGLMAKATAIINAEIALGRAAHPERPIYLVKADLRDFYPSLSHELILDMLARFGLSEEQRGFFQRFLAVPLRTEDGVVYAQRGVPNMRRLSDLLGELVLRLLDAHLHRSARVVLVRVMDDICMIAADPEEARRGWQALQAFCEHCGLTPNLAKCGTVVIGGEHPDGLPEGPFTWQFLTLESDGAWTVTQRALEHFLQQARWRMDQAGALLSKIELYNSHVALLSNLTGLSAPLGQQHRASLRQTFHTVQATLWDADLSAAIQRKLRIHLPNLPGDQPVPEAWIAWPMTAGGLGATATAIVVGKYAVGFAKRPPARAPEHRPSDWHHGDRAWSAFYRQLLTLVEPEEPDQQAVMETLVNDFIARGGEISSGRQTSLSLYWRWVLYSYGPQLLDTFGTFRFLITELVPLQLIVQRRLGDTEASRLMLQAAEA